MLQAELEQQFHHAMQAYLSGHLEKAAAQFSDITRQWPACVEAWFQQAEIAEQRHQLSDAVTYYEQVLEQNPTIQEAWFRLGTIAAQQQAEPLAIQYWQQALSINPDYAEAHLHLALLYAQKVQNAQNTISAAEAAATHFARACALSPEPLTLLSLARTLLWQNQHGVVTLLLDSFLQHLKNQPPRPEDQAYWKYALALRIQLAHEQRDDALALNLLETPQQASGEQAGPDRHIAETLKALYLSLDASPEAQEAFKEKLSQEQTPPIFDLEQAPRLLAWQKYGVQARVNTYLQGTSPLVSPPTFPARPLFQQPVLTLVCVMYESALPLWPLYLQHLRTLPARNWHIHVVLCHQLAVPMDGLKAQIHRVQSTALVPLLQQLPADLLLHAGADRQSSAVASALTCRPLEKPSLNWTLYGPSEVLWQNTPEDPCFSGVLLLKSLQDPLQNALHLHRWSVYLQHHLRQASGV